VSTTNEVLVYINDVRTPLEAVTATEWERCADILITTTAAFFKQLTLDTPASVW
jgi:hypothetical protein